MTDLIMPWYDEDFPYPHLDPEDDPRLKDKLSWYDSDNDARSPLEADWDDIDE